MALNILKAQRAYLPYAQAASIQQPDYTIFFERQGCCKELHHFFLRHNIGKDKLFFGIKIGGYNVRCRQYALKEKAAGLCYATTLGPAYLMYFFYVLQVLFYICLPDVCNCFMVVVLKEESHLLAVVAHAALAKLFYYHRLA